MEGKTGSSGAGKARRVLPSGANGVEELFTPRYGLAGTSTCPFITGLFEDGPVDSNEVDGDAEGGEESDDGSEESDDGSEVVD